jgi:hypothetical protein
MPRLLARILLVSPWKLQPAETTMAAITADVSLKSEEEAKAPSESRLDMAFAMSLAAGRFASPAGIVFVQHNYLPTQYRKPR